MTEEKTGKKCKCCTIIGIIVLVLGLFADYIGIGGGMGYGTKQLIVIAVGLFLIVIGTKPCKFGKICKLK